MKGLSTISRARLREALGHARAGRFREARAALEAAVRTGATPAACFVGASIAYVCRDYQRSLELFERATADDRLAPHALRERIRRAGRLGWSHDVRATLERALSRSPDDPRWHLEALRVASRARDHAAALEHADRALALDPRASSARMQRAGLLAKVGRSGAAVAEARRAAAAEGTLPYRLEAARVALDAGDYGAAREQYEEVVTGFPSDVRGPLGLATLALFWGDLDAAGTWLARAREVDRDDPAVLRVAGAIACLRGDLDAAVEALDDALVRDPDDAEAHLWRAEARFRRTLARGDLPRGGLAESAEERGDLHQALMKADGFMLGVWLLRALAVVEAGDPRPMRRAHLFDELWPGLCALVPDGPRELEGGDRGRLLLERGLAELRGNRTVMPSHVVDGVLVRLRAPEGPRFASRRALELIRATPAAVALAALDAVVAAHPRSSLPICHRGELRLWLGDTEGARADLEAAIGITPQTRWAWIGLTGVEILEGRPDRALEVSARGIETMDGTVGASVYAYRAEALLALGRLDEALEDLDRSVAASPTRVGAWVLLGLTRAQRSEDGELAVVWRHLEDRAGALLADAAREIQVEPWPTAGARPAPEEMQRVLAHALHMMRGNRSSTCVTYLTRAGTIRYVPGRGTGRRPHDTDADDLRAVDRFLGGR